MSVFGFAKKQVPLEEFGKIPRHVAIIMDGNGRWARGRGLPTSLGHRQGGEALRTLLKGVRELGIEYLTIYAFSSENWQRPEEEVQDLMELLRQYLQREVSQLHSNGVRLRVIGDRNRMDGDIRGDIMNAEKLTAGNSRFHLNVALSYGGREEIARAARALAEDVAAGRLQPDDISEERLTAALDTCDLPDPDLLIRTGGDQRLSNFLLWQSAYTEFYFTPVLWPDFTTQHLKEAVQDYAMRERRFGGR